MLDETENSELPRAKKRAMYLLGERAYCSGELYKKLKNNYSDDTCEKVCKLMTDYGYLNDELYAERYATKLIHSKHYGKHRALADMRMKGLPDALCERVLAEFPDEDIRDEIRAIIEKKYSDSLDGDYKETQKVIAALARRGYSYSDIKDCISELRDRADDDFEEFIE